jgi:glycosyltransferase involved in cell wall biosynthesis
MKIAVVSKLWEETSPLSTGGTGASVGILVDGLVKRGHKVTLFATGNSRTQAQELAAVREEPFRGDYSEVQDYEHIADAFRRHKEFDIIHCAVEHKSVLFAELVSTPSVHSIRYGEFFEHERALLEKYQHLDYMANSEAVANSLPFLNWQGVVYNGIDSERFPFGSEPEDYLFFLGRISPQKGPDIAIRLARKLDKRLFLAGKMEETDRKFLDKEILPQVDGKQIVYLGELGFDEKIDYLKKARAVVYPNRVFEACSNVLLEAMACGTPPVAFDVGSSAELIKHGLTGFVVKDEKSMAEALKKTDSINRRHCREHVEAKFSDTRMVDGYEALFNKIIQANGK